MKITLRVVDTSEETVYMKVEDVEYVGVYRGGGLLYTCLNEWRIYSECSPDINSSRHKLWIWGTDENEDSNTVACSRAEFGSFVEAMNSIASVIYDLDMVGGIDIPATQAPKPMMLRKSYILTGDSDMAIEKLINRMKEVLPLYVYKGEKIC